MHGRQPNSWIMTPSERYEILRVIIEIVICLNSKRVDEGVKFCAGELLEKSKPEDNRDGVVMVQ